MGVISHLSSCGKLANWRCRLHWRLWASDTESFPYAIEGTAGNGCSVLGSNSWMVPSIWDVAGAEIGPSKMMLDRFVWVYGWWSSVTIDGTNSSESTEASRRCRRVWAGLLISVDWIYHMFQWGCLAKQISGRTFPLEKTLLADFTEVPINTW
jgi:hypothetical protein